MVGGAVEDTFIVMPGDVALDGVAHVALLVITTVTVTPFDKPLFEYVLLFVPTLLPFIFH